MIKYTYQLTTLSTLIVSPRANLAFYELSEEEKPEDKEGSKHNKSKLIYPFYQYGTYEFEQYDPKKAEYYLPGSTIKGALNQKSCAAGEIMVDDISIRNNDIMRKTLYKAQYLEDLKVAKFETFFNNIEIEMLKASANYEGTIYLREKRIEELMESASKFAQIKIKQMVLYFEELAKRKYKEKFLEELCKAKEELTRYQDSTNIILLGGYKGLLHSMEVKLPKEEQTGAIFLDKETNLPHGLVRIEV